MGSKLEARFLSSLSGLSLGENTHYLHFIQPIADVISPISAQPIGLDQLNSIQQVVNKAFEELNKRKSSFSSTLQESIELNQIQKFLEIIKVNLEIFIKSVNVENPIYIPSLMVESIWKRIQGDFGTTFLDSGNFSSIHQVKCTDGTTYALKKKLSSDEHSKRIFCVEQTMFSRISSDWIIGFFGFDRTGDIFLECAKWDLLKRVEQLNKDSPVPKEFSDITRSILKGIAYLHGKKIAHRDIKPENILITSEKRVKIADFGLSYQLELGEEKAQISIAGSAEFIGPEYAQSDDLIADVSFKSDIWAVGGTVFYLLHQFSLIGKILDKEPGFDDIAKVYRMYKGYPEPLSEKIQNIVKFNQDCSYQEKLYVHKDHEESALLRDIASKCFTFDPNKRPGADELLQTYFP